MCRNALLCLVRAPLQGLRVPRTRSLVPLAPILLRRRQLCHIHLHWNPMVLRTILTQDSIYPIRIIILHIPLRSWGWDVW